jgi:hypothetical protein
MLENGERLTEINRHGVAPFCVGLQSYCLPAARLAEPNAYILNCDSFAGTWRLPSEVVLIRLAVV